MKALLGFPSISSNHHPLNNLASIVAEKFSMVKKEFHDGRYVILKKLVNGYDGTGFMTALVLALIII